MSEPTEQNREPLLIERIARWLGFERLSEWLPGDIYPPYLYVVFFVLFDAGVLNVYKHLTGGTHALLVSPSWISIPLGLLLGVFGIRYMSEQYRRTVRDLRIDDRLGAEHRAAFEETVPIRVELAVFGIAVGLYFANFLATGFGTIAAYEGVVVAIASYLFLQPFVYLPIVVEFGLVYFSVHVLLPRRIETAGLGLFFYDPRNMGGFGSVGELLKRSYYLFTAGLLLYFFSKYGPWLLSQIGPVPYPEPGVSTAVFFSVAWLVGCLSIAYSMLSLHRIMSEEKETKIRELEDEMRDIIENPYDINASSVTDESELEDVTRRLEQVRSTRVYPATFTMWSQIGISVLLPQVLQVALRATM
ncbi:hypothetical protein [Halobellus sp. EA9]|uniref:hypothetical protein n=1 Tax=Halobellus sp. EA9 TaxID=3421647 RepID=UPI003EBB6709